jgi:hypothetical protein
MKRIALFCLLSALLLGEAHAGPLAPSTAEAPPASWDGATPLPLARPSKSCAAVRLGAWARVTCVKLDFVMDVRLLGGAHEGVSFREAKAEEGVHVIFPMHPGDRREIAVATEVPVLGYTVEEEAKVVISELWLPGEADPTIAVATYP